MQQLADYAIKNGDQAEAKNISRRCMDEVSQVPEAVIFDKYRLRFLFTAASIANSAMTCGNGGLFSGPRDHDLGVYAVAVWDECLKRTDDPAGEFRERRAWALAYEGELDKAYAQASVPAVYNMRKDTTRYARAMAALQAQRGQLKAAWKWLRYDITTLHDTDTAWIRESSDFSPLRLDDKAAFDLLVPPSP